MKKVCKKCGERKDLRAFVKYYWEGGIKRRNECEECSYKRHKMWADEHRESLREYNRKYTRKDKQKRLEYLRSFWGKIRKENREKYNYYNRVHQWIKRELGKPTICNGCGKTGLVGRQINLANNIGNYLKTIEDWLSLCLKCHLKYDKGHIRS